MSDPSHSARSGPRAESLFSYIGARLRNRRVELGLATSAVADRLGIAQRRYEEFESGQVQVPAVALGDLAEFFEVPLFYFFQDMPSGEDEAPATVSEPAVALTVATEADRVAALVRYFLNSDWEGQLYLLMLARTLARDGGDSECGLG